MKNKLEEIRERTSSVDGRIDIEEAKMLYLLAREGDGEGDIVEIGSFQGYSTIWLASGSMDRKREKVYAVDPHCTDLHGNNEIIFRENIKKAGVDDYVIPVVKTSTEAVKDWNRPIRLLFIDGAHDYENAKNDFLLWEKHLIHGGIVAFHDCYCIFWPDVGDVVNECVFNSDRFSDIGCVNTVIYARKTKKLSPVEKVKNENFKRRLLPRGKAVHNFQKAETMIKGGLYNEAENLLMSVESDINDFITPEYSLLNLNSIGNYYRRIGRYEKAEKIFYKILAHNIKDDSSLVHKKYRAFLNLGDLYFAQKKYMESINRYKEVISEDGFFRKGKYQALLGLGRCYYALNMYDEAEQNFKEALAIEDVLENERYFALQGIGRCLYARNSYKKVEERYSEAFSLEKITNEQRVGAADELINCFLAQGKFNEITGVVEKVLLLDGVFEHVKINLVRTIRNIINNLQKS